MRKLIKLAVAAARCGLKSTKQFQRWIERGLFPREAVYRMPGYLAVDEDELEAWLEQRKGC